MNSVAFRFALALVVSSAAAGCQTPLLVFSGGALTGPEARTDSFSFASRHNVLKLEVRPRDPYSVNLRVIVRERELYIDAADRRRWHTYIKQDPNVRVKLGDSVYRATAVRVDDPEITGQFLAGRTIYRLVPNR